MRFVGEAVALVVAETEAAAQDAAERIVVDYRDLPVVIEAADALEAAAPLIHTDVPRNLAVDYEYGSGTAVEGSLRQGGASGAPDARGTAHFRQSDGAKVVPSGL